MNYPPGVTGLEFEIAGPDYEKEIEDRPCPKCDADALMEYGYRREQWVQCCACEFRMDWEQFNDIEEP